MITPKLPDDEAQRLGTLRALDILDTDPEERFDRLTRLAKRLFGVPIALISLVDANRQWFKSCQGLNASETSRDVSFCGHTILSDDILVVEDALLDQRFFDNPLVIGEPKIRFYAGCPLGAANGAKLGTLCLIDREPRVMTSEDLALLRDLTTMAQQEIAAVQLATSDELTGLSNRRGFLMLGQYALNTSARLSLSAALIFFDLDEFKPINDQFGHTEGDCALKLFAALLLQNFRDSDIVGRLAGDEFVVLMTNCTEADIQVALERFQAAINDYNQTSERRYALRFSVGIATYQHDKHCSLNELIERADKAMYECKKLRTQRRTQFFPLSEENTKISQN